MKRKRRYCRRILSMILCFAMILGNYPICAEAKESQMQPIQAVQMDGMAEPTEFPAKGTIHTYVLQTDSMENYENSFKEAYLSVLVDQEHQVYASLSDLKDFLDLQVKVGTVLENGKARRTVRWHNTMLVMYEGNPEALYVKSLKKGNNDYDRDNLNLYFSLGNAPVIKDDEFYVPMDAFLQCTGSFAFYSGENEDGKQDLYLVPPQRTVLDDILGYVDDLYSIYAFSMEKDFGMTEDGVRNTYYSAEAVQFLKRFGSIFDGAAWSESVIGDRFFAL